MPREVVHAVNLDANESIFFARQLEFIKSKTYDIDYPELKAMSLIPVSTEAGPGAESITYEQYDQVGVAKIISSYADDLPRSDVKGKQFTAPIRSIGASYGYNVQEVRASAMANKNLPQRRANACRRSHDQTTNTIAWFARANDGVNGGLTGLLYNPNVTSGIVASGAGGGGTAKKFVDKTPAEILKDLNGIVNGIIALTKGVEVPDTILLPIAQYTYIATTQNAAGTDTTILEYFKRNNPIITLVDWVNELKDVNPIPSTLVASATDCMVCFKRSPDKLTLEIPQPFEQFPVQERGLEYMIPTHSRCGGVIVYYPLSISIKEGI